MKLRERTQRLPEVITLRNRGVVACNALFVQHACTVSISALRLIHYHDIHNTLRGGHRPTLRVAKQLSGNSIEKIDRFSLQNGRPNDETYTQT